MTRNWSETFYKLATILLLIGLGYVVLLAMSYLQDVLSIVVSSMLIAYVLQMAVEPLSRRIPRWLAVGLVVTVFFIVLTAAVSLIVPQMVTQIQMLIGHMPAELENFQQLLNRLGERLATRNIQLDLRVDSWLLPRLESLGQNAATNLPGLLIGSFSGFFATAMILVCSFYFLMDGSRMWQQLMDLLPERAATQAEFFRLELDRSLSRYLRGQLINAGLVLGAASTVFSALGMTYGVIAGLIWGVAEIIPYFGLYLGFGTALLLASMQGVSILGKVFLAGVVIWWTKDNIIAPRVMSHTTGLHPILIIVAVLTGGKLAGFLGILLAIPVTAVVVTTLRFWLLQRRERHLIVSEVRGSATPPTLPEI